MISLFAFHSARGRLSALPPKECLMPFSHLYSCFTSSPESEHNFSKGTKTSRMFWEFLSNLRDCKKLEEEHKLMQECM